VKKSLRIVLVVAVLASLAPIALAAGAPTGGVPQPQVTALTSSSVFTSWWSVLIAAFLSWLSH
jgi:hypothetical protein